jgi:hypothetical protein
MSRLLLQICTALLAPIPIATGIVSMPGVKDPLYRPLGLPEAPVLDSNLGFFGGIWLGLGDPLSSSVGGSIPGGVGRVLSWIQTGPAPKPYVGFIILELLGAPLFIYWQYRLAQSVVTL